jgi:hypothetical protein
LSIDEAGGGAAFVAVVVMTSCCPAPVVRVVTVVSVAGGTAAFASLAVWGAPVVGAVVELGDVCAPLSCAVATNGTEAREKAVAVASKSGRIRLLLRVVACCWLYETA